MTTHTTFYTRVERRDCVCVREDALQSSWPLLRGYFSLFPNRDVFVEDEEGRLTGVFTLPAFRRSMEAGALTPVRVFSTITWGPGWAEEADAFFRETIHRWLPVLEENGRLHSYCVRHYDIWENAEFADTSKWLDISTDYFARLLQIKGCRKLKVFTPNALGEQVYRYLRHYETCFESVEKIGWRELKAAQPGETLLVTPKVGGDRRVIKAQVLSILALMAELEYHLLLSTCKEKDVKLYFVTVPCKENVWNMTEEEKNRERSWIPYLENREEYRELLEEVFADVEDKEAFFDAVLASDFQVIEEGRCRACDCRGKYFNVAGGERVTMGVPREVRNHIYLAGNSFVWGHHVDDAHTLSSQLQERINRLPQFQYYGVVNEGLRALPIEGSLKKLNEDLLKPGDIVVLFFWPAQRNTDCDTSIFSNMRVHHMEDVFNALDRGRVKSYFTDAPEHPNAFGYRLAADYLEELLQGPCYDGWKEHMVLNIFSRESVEEIDEKDHGFQEYLRKLKGMRREGRTGAIVMNCNPLTYGHKHLISFAASQVEHLFVFVVQEDKSAFSFEERFEMVRSCGEEYPNVTVLPSGSYIASMRTLEGYFTIKKERIFDGEGIEKTVDMSQDVLLFAKYIAPALNITVRFVGEEPLDYVTAQYNQAMKRWFPKYGVELVEIPRYVKEINGREEILSASKVREAISHGDWEGVRCRVPETTLRILEKKYR